MQRETAARNPRVPGGRGEMSDSLQPPVGYLENRYRSLVDANSERLTGVRGALASASGGKKLGSLMVTSSSPGEGKTVAALSIAHALSVLGSSSVLFVDCNPVNPSVHSLFGLANSPGLTEYVSGQSDLVDAVHATEFNKLSVMVYGGADSPVSDLFGSPKFEQRYDELRAQFDMVILDTSSVLTSSEPCILAPFVDGAVLVIRCERTRWETVQRAIHTIETMGDQIVGCVLNRRRYPIPRLLYR